MSETTKIPPAHVIDERQHAAKQYRIITADEEIIQQTGEQIVRGCRLQMTAAVWSQNFHRAVAHVADWCEKRSSQIAVALVDLRTDKIVFYLIPQGEQFDFDLAEDQAGLDMDLNARASIGYVESRQVPGWELDRFVGEAYRVYPRD